MIALIARSATGVPPQCGTSLTAIHQGRVGGRSTASPMPSMWAHHGRPPSLRCFGAGCYRPGSPQLVRPQDRRGSWGPAPPVWRSRRGSTTIRTRADGVTQGYVAQLESGLKKNPSLPTLKKLARALGVPVKELLE
jgi:hypothetical protein